MCCTAQRFGAFVQDVVTECVLHHEKYHVDFCLDDREKASKSENIKQFKKKKF